LALTEKEKVVSFSWERIVLFTRRKQSRCVYIQLLAEQEGDKEMVMCMARDDLSVWHFVEHLACAPGFVD